MLDRKELAKVKLSKHFDKLKKNRSQLTKQEYRTIKGQLISGDVAGGIKGLNAVLKRKAEMEVIDNGKQNAN